MTYQTTERFEKAIDPSGLNAITSAHSALAGAIDQARRAGVSPDNDDAVKLLAMRIGEIARAPKSALLANCKASIKALHIRHPIEQLASRDLAHDKTGLSDWRHSCLQYLRALAQEWQIDRFDIAHMSALKTHPCQATMSTDFATVQIAHEMMGVPGIRYQAVRKGRLCGDIHRIKIADAGPIPDLAHRIITDLRTFA